MKAEANPTVLSNAALAMICSLIVFSPLARGSVHGWHISVLQIGILLSLILLFMENIYYGISFIPPTPLNQPITALIILAFSSLVFTHHFPLALDSVMLLLTYVSAFFIVQSSVRTRKHQRMVIYTIVGTALFLTVFGLFKRFGLNPFLFWQYDELRYSPEFLSSTFGNHNHFAGFNEMSFPFVLGMLLMKRRRRSTKLLLCYAAFLLIVAQALSLSRGGWISMTASIIFMMALLLYKNQFYVKKIIFTLLTIFVLISIFVLASSTIVTRILTISEQDQSASLESRIQAWKGTFDIITQHPLIGTGPGTYEAVFPGYKPPGLGLVFKQAHNDYLQAVSDLGVFVLPILFWAVHVFFKNGFKQANSPSRQVKSIAMAAMAAVVAILVHSINDFNMHIPSNAYLLAVILGVVNYQRKERS